LIPDDNLRTIAQALNEHWFRTLGLPDKIYFKGGKVEGSKLAQEVECSIRPADNGAPKCKSHQLTFNTETELPPMGKK
jgi:hypothetical protein